MPLHYTDREPVEQPAVVAPTFDQSNVALSFRARPKVHMRKAPSKSNKWILIIILIISVLALFYGLKMMKQNKPGEFFYF